MILQRIARALRQQDWFTVMLEVIIVVGGIFVALQVDQWATERELDRRESAYLAALGEDLRAMLDSLEVEMADRNERREIMIRAFQALEACDDSPAARADVQVALDQYQVGGRTLYVGATFDEMVATGALARLTDTSLKRSIAATFSDLERLNVRLNAIRLSLPVVDAILWEHVSYGIDESGRFQSRVDIPALCGIREVRNAFIEMIDIQADQYGFINNVWEQVNDLLIRLDA